MRTALILGAVALGVLAYASKKKMEGRSADSDDKNEGSTKVGAFARNPLTRGSNLPPQPSPTPKPFGDIIAVQPSVTKRRFTNR